MADWNRTFTSTRYRFMRVSRATGLEVSRLTMLRSGSITRNNDVRIMETAEVGVVGAFDIGPDLVRVYMDAEWPDGASETVCLGTFIPSVPSRKVKSGYSTSTVKLYGRLQELLDDKFTDPVTLQPGANAVDEARKVCEGAGLSVLADPCDYRITKARSYGVGASQSNSETGDTKLDMVNDLLSLADFQAAKTDPMGTVLLRRYVQPEDRAPSWEMAEGPSCRFEAEMDDERDTTSVANHVVVYYRGDDKTVVGEAWDHETEFSVEAQGRTITQTYEYTELPEGGSDAEMTAYADRRASTLMATAQAVIRRVMATHSYAPVTIGDSVTLDYPSGGVQGKFEVRTMTLNLVGGCKTNTEFRQFQRRRSG